MIETVRIVKDHRPGYATINRSDFDPSRHELFDKPAEEDSGDGWTVKALKVKLGELGISIPRGASKADMIELLPEDEE